MSKSVAYLLGSGATHAVVNALDSSRGLLTQHVRKVISNRKSELKDKIFPTNIWNEIIDDRVDIEHLISTSEASYNYKVTNELRKEYSKAISELAKNVVSPKNLENNLYTVLFDMHKIKGFSEIVSCVLTLNYENILEESIGHLGQKPFYIMDGHSKSDLKDTIPIIKLHGSFNWRNVRPVEVDDMEKVVSESEPLWIPPGVEKKKEKYPFNLLWGRAFEYLLECDILRIIGCSLSRNDWDLIPLIYSTNKFNSSGRPFEIEIIDYPNQCDRIREQYQYLSIKHILDLPEVSAFLMKEHFPKHAEAMKKKKVKLSMTTSMKEEISESIEPSRYNIFSMWLQAMGEGLIENGTDIKTKNNVFNEFIRNNMRA